MFEVAQTPLHTPAIPSLLDEVHQQILSILELEGTHEGCGTLLLPKLVARTVVLHEMFLKPPFHRIVYVGGNPMCQLTFHCRLVVVLSLLHLPHHVWRLNHEHLCLLTEHTACFEFAKGRSLSNPIQA